MQLAVELDENLGGTSPRYTRSFEYSIMTSLVLFDVSNQRAETERSTVNKLIEQCVT